MEERSLYVADTHILYWFLREPNKLSPAAVAVFRLAASGNAVILVPAIVVAETYFFTMKRGHPLLPSELLDMIEDTEGLHFSPLGRPQLERLQDFDKISEMHDRLIAAESLLFDAPLVTKDRVLRSQTSLRTIW